LRTHETIERLQETVNRLIGGILPFALMGRDITIDYAAPKQIDCTLDDRTLHRAWDAVQFATDNAPDPTVILPQLFDQATVDLLRSYGLHRADRSAQVYYLAQIVIAQTRQLQSHELQESQRDGRELHAGGE
jgi:hypothetical protein